MKGKIQKRTRSDVTELQADNFFLKKKRRKKRATNE
jgi:hypothetical protein